MRNNGTERGRDHIPEGDQIKQNKEEKDQTQTQTPHTGQDMAWAVWKQFPDKPQCDESVSLDIEGIKSLTERIYSRNGCENEHRQRW